MAIALIVAVICTILLICSVILNKKEKKALKKRVNSSGAKQYMQGTHIEGLPLPSGANVELFAYDDKLHIESPNGKFDIYNDKIINISAFDELEIVHANKSVVGRAVVGGVLLGGLGAIVGGISGTGTKQKGKTKYYLIVNYRNSNNEIAVLSFENSTVNMKEVAKKFELVAGIDKSQTITL